MKTIYKYTIVQLGEPTSFNIPLEAEILTAQKQGNHIAIWALLDPSQIPTKLTRTFQIFGTGWNITEEKPMRWVATVADGQFIWHVFEINPPVWQITESGTPSATRP